jgi:adenylate cyclase
VAAVLAARKVSADDVHLDGDILRMGAARAPVRATVVPPVAPGGQTGSAREIILRYPRPVTGADQFTSIFPTYSFLDVLLSEDRLSEGKAPPIPESAFKDKIVFVGLRLANTNENFTTPFGPGADIVGVELHATLAHNILTGVFMRRATAATDVALTMTVAMAAGLIAAMIPAVWATGAVLALAGAIGAWLTYEVGGGVWRAAVTPLVAAAVALFGGVAWQYLVEDRAKRQVKQLFGRYVSKDVIAQLMADPALARLGGQRREMTVLFSDIRNFTTATEAGTPEDVVTQLNEYFSAMVDVLFRHQGTLDKFVGDMVMGLFGAPLDDPKHADHAVAAALEMRAELARLNARWSAEGKPPVDIGIGINTGEMIAGNIGSQAIMSYTVIGDNVNLGARLESLNKEYKTRIIISDATRSRLTGNYPIRPLGDVIVKGKSKSVEIFEVQVPAPLVEVQTI